MKLNQLKLSKSNWIIALIGSLLFSYTFYRAIVLSITWDEAFSYCEFIKNDIFLLEKYEGMSANNHILNSLGGIIFSSLFGVSEFTLRIPSLIAHLFFIYYSAKLVSTFENKWISISAFLILNFNPYMLDFFSLSRGYSLSLGFMMASIYYFYRFHITEFKIKYAVASIIFAEIATLGNFTLLNYCVVLYGLIVLLIILRNLKQVEKSALIFKQIIKELLFPTLLIALFLWFVLPIAFELKEAGALFFGGESFWRDTIGTIIPRLWYGLDFSNWLLRISKVFILMALAASTLVVIYKLIKGKITFRNHFLSSLLLLFYLIILSTVVQHYLLGTLYLMERTVLFLYVLLMIIFIFLIVELTAEKKIIQGIIHFTATLVLVHFIFSINSSYVFEWKEDCETRAMLIDLEKQRNQPSDKFNISIGVPLAFSSSIDYYRTVNHLSWLNESERMKNINYMHDYFFLRPIDLENANKDSIVVIKTYPVTKNSLVKPKYPFNKSTVIFDSIYMHQNGPIVNIGSDLEYSPGISYYLPDSIPLKNCILSCKIDFQTEDNFSGNVLFITSYQNKEGSYSWTKNRVNDFLFSTNRLSSAMYSSFIPEEAKAGDELKVYIWNPFKQKLVIKKLHLKLIKYSYNEI